MSASSTLVVYRGAHGVLDGAWVDAPWLAVDEGGTITATGHAGAPEATPPEGAIVRDLGPVMLLPGMVNAHSHAFQRAIRGATHRRGVADPSSFWSWREAMYRCAQQLEPQDVYEITRQAYAEMLAAGITCVGVFHLEPMTFEDSLWMLALCISGAGGHFLLIKAYEAAEASVIQPFAYFQLVFVTIIGVGVFGEMLDPVTVLGATVVVAAGLYTAWRERRA